MKLEEIPTNKQKFYEKISIFVLQMLKNQMTPTCAFDATRLLQLL
jgi:hypothetical protein